MEEKHTPGPWQYHENKIPVSGKRNEVRNKDGLLICYVNIGMSDFVANAELIARSPELLQQVEQLEAERSELRNKIQNRFDNVADLIGLVQQTNDTITMVRLQSEFSFLDDLLNSLKTK